jgi:hypothetical protein
VNVPERGHRKQALTMSYATGKFGIRTLAGVLMALALAGAAAPAEAGTAYDGSWNVVIHSSNTACKGSQLPLKIENGRLGYSGYVPASVSGSVGGNGAVTVNVSGGGRSANGSGRLSGNSGSGTWSGGSASSACSGTWSASRKA